MLSFASERRWTLMTDDTELTEEPVVKPRFTKSWYFKPGYWKIIRKVKRWRNDSEAAKALGFCKGQISLVVRGRAKVSDDFMARLAIALNNHWEDAWGAYYELREDPRKKSFQRFNHDKFNGVVPYVKYSDQAVFRRDEGPIETE
jgi:hypothetical protein